MNTRVFLHTAAIDDFTVARPSECNAPVLSLNLPSPIPVPPGSATAPNVQLHIEYTRINIEEQSGAGQVGGEEVFVMQYDARILTQSNHMQVRVGFRGNLAGNVLLP